MKPSPPTLDRINSLYDDCNAFLDSYAAEVKKKEAPDVPVLVIRNIHTNRFGGDPIRAVKSILEQQS